ncbi:MAG TPA: phosphoglucosamine mutase [Ignavibacteria bacterium]|nr:phosphoglucosamine mutase [Ignavibacteria bacterium]HMR40566.1 phosphoglucosamine mutase [Ignavibacteria bacterium]
MTDIIASVSGVRGIVGDSLTPENVIKFTSAFAEYCRRNSNKKSGSKDKPVKIVIGSDGRLNGEIFEYMVVSNLALCGCDVVNIGIAPTPTVQIATEDLKSDGGIAITASHNPQIWNGLKFLNPDGTFLDEKQVLEFLKIADKGSFRYAGINELGSITSDYSWTEKHIEKVLKLKILDIKKIKKRKFRVVVDAVNSSGSVIVPVLLEQLGCEVIRLFCDGSGKFPHTPEPIPENLTELSSAVKKYKADIGISVDPDADRLVLITDKGEPFSEENTITTAANFVLKKAKGTKKSVTVNLSTTRSVDDIAALNKAIVYRSPVGEINVVKEMKKNKSNIGGEGSGGVIYPELHYGRDSLAGIVLVLNEIADSGLKLSEYKKNLPEYHISKAKIEGLKDPGKVLKAFEKKFRKDKDITGISTADGLKVDFKDHWIHMRKSNTEPIIRIITEAKSGKDAIKIQKDIAAEII